VIRPPDYLVWSRTFLLGVGLTDPSDFWPVLGSKQGNSGCAFNGPAIYCNVGSTYRISYNATPGMAMFNGTTKAESGRPMKWAVLARASPGHGAPFLVPSPIGHWPYHININHKMRGI
jgi:hypothetical protein